jgi:NhaA family Na+:H+ antiporter
VLPDALATRVTRALETFLRTEASGGVVLLAATVIALLWANSPLAGLYHHVRETHLGFHVGGDTFTLSVEGWINDGLMAVFFFVVGLEIKREILVGELSSLRRATLPVAAAFGGAVLPALLYLALNHGGPHAAGWGVPIATDIAFAVGILTLLRSRTPEWLKSFLVALAIADDLIAVAVIALFYTSGISVGPLLAAAGILAAMVALNLAGAQRSAWFVVPAVAMWAAVLASGVHATVAGVAAAAVIPARPPSSRSGTRGPQDPESEESPLTRLEHRVLPWTTYLVLPLFALVNAGVAIPASALARTLTSPLTLGVVAGLVLGKPVGIVAAAWLARAAGLARLPEGARWSELAGAACLGGVGFTMSIFIASLAFAEGDTLDLARMGILLGSLISAVLGFGILRLTTAGRRDTPVGEADESRTL